MLSTAKALATRRWFAPGLLVALGLLWRLLYLARDRSEPYVLGEATNAAVSIATEGTIADVFGPGSGPSAHLGPVMPIIAGTVYRLLGVHTPVAEWTLSLMAIGYVLGAAALLYVAFGEMGAPRWSRLPALACACLLPMFPQMEVKAFRVWEGGLAALLAAAMLFLIVRADRHEDTSPSTVLVISALGAVLFFVSPPLGLAGYAGAALLALRRLPAGRWFSTAMVAAVALVAVATPWTVRNMAVFDRFIPLRDNFGLELALGSYPARPGVSAEQAYQERFRSIHPIAGKDVLARMHAAGGEAAYAERMGAETKRWIAADPTGFALSGWRHAKQFFFPPAWLWRTTGVGVTVKQVLVWLFSLGALIGAAIALRRWSTPLIYAAIFVVLPALPYLVVQPTLRYHFLIHLPSIFLAGEAARLLLSRVRRPAPQWTDMRVA